MSSDEEYLDSLLKSIMDDEETSDSLSEEAEEAMNAGAPEDNGETKGIEPEEAEGTEAALPDDFAIQDFGEEESPENEEQFSENKEETSENEEEAEETETEEAEKTEAALPDDFAIQDFGEEETFEGVEAFVEDGEAEETEPGDVIESQDSSPDEMDELEALLKEVNGTASEEEQPEKGGEDDDSDMDDELAEISGLLKQSGDESMTDDDMLALLESMSADSADSVEETAGEAQETEEGKAAAESYTDTEPEDKETEEDGEKKKKEKKKKRSGRFGRKKKKETEKTEEAEVEVDAEEVEWIDPDAGFDLPEAPKKNFFARVLSFLTEADEEAKPGMEQGLEPSDENRNILEELDEEDKKKKKKKIKGKKGKKEGTAETGEDGEEEELAEPEKKQKKEKKKEKKIKVSEEAPEKEKKPGKKISPRNIGVIAGLSLTLAAVIVVLSTIVPAFFDKRNAREAYYKADYSKSFELLYGKKLDNSDTIIYNKSKIILQMNRKLDSYHNYVSLGKEVEALDALISGVERYPSIYQDAEEYHVTEEVNAVYQTILTLLTDRFAVSETQAKEIIAYDDLAYTLKLESIVNGTPFVMPTGSGANTPAPVAEQQETRMDLLPEEQELIGEGVEAVTVEAVTVEAATEEAPANDGVQAEFPTTGAPAEPTQAPPESQEQAPEPKPAQEQEIPALTTQNAGAETDGTQGGTEGTDSAPDGSRQEEPVYGSEGQRIQGVQQPVEINIHP